MTIRLIFLATALLGALTSQAAFAQRTPTSEKFLEAVRKEDAGTAFQLISELPTVVNAREEKGDTALLLVVRRKDAEWTSYLLNAKADVDLAGRDGDTPLIVAARIGFHDAIPWMMKRGAKVDVANKLGETPLIAAVQARNARIVNLLLEAGANPDKTDYAGYSARDYAKRDTRSREMGQIIEAKKPKK